jgi:hypothetical protein
MRAWVVCGLVAAYPQRRFPKLGAAGTRAIQGPQVPGAVYATGRARPRAWRLGPRLPGPGRRPPEGERDAAPPANCQRRLELAPAVACCRAAGQAH